MIETTNKKLFAMWVLTFLALIGNTALTAYNIDVLKRIEIEVEKAHRVNTVLDAVGSAIVNMETGMRGFVIVNDESFLEPYTDGAASLVAHRGELDKLTAEDAAQRGILESLHSLVLLQESHFLQVINARKQGGLPAAEKLIRTLRGKLQMDEIRKQIDKMHALATEQLQAQAALARSKFKMTLQLVFAGGLLTLMLSALAFFSVRRELSRRRLVEDELRKTAGSLSKAQDSTRLTLARLDAFLFHAPLGIAFFDPELRFVHVNRFFTSARRIPEGTMVGNSLRAYPHLLPEEIEVDCRQALGPAGQIVHRTFEFNSNGSKTRTAWQVSVFPVRDAVLGTVGVGLVGLDITDRLHSEREVRESEARFRLLTQAIPIIVCMSDSDGCPTFFNRRWLEYTGVPVEQAIHLGWQRVIHQEDADGYLQNWEAAVQAGSDDFRARLRLRRAADGEYRWHQSVAVPLRSDSGAIRQWILSLADIDDEVRQAEHLETLVRDRATELIRLNTALREEVAERSRAEERERTAALELKRSNEELEKFAYVASHDLQEPLRKIQAFGDRLQSRCGDQLQEQGQEFLQRILSSAGRMRRLIDDLLSFSRVATQARAFAAVDLNELLAEVSSDLEFRLNQTQGRIDVGSLPVIQADPLQMRQLFQNLLGNALKFHKREMPPVVEVRAIRFPELPSEQRETLPSENGWRITITDNGIGFEPEYAQRIFELFQRLHGREEYEGTGIGLAICRKIVERHGGTIHARSEQGRGTCFIVDLPQSIAPSERRPQ